MNERFTSHENTLKVDINDKQVKNFDFNYCEPKLNKTISKCYQFDISRTTVIHLLLSQFTLALLHYDFGFLFANVSLLTI